MLRLPGHLGRRRDEPAPGERRRAAARRVRVRRGGARGIRGHARPGARSARPRAFDWFLGRNRLDLPLYDFATGGCSDGLGEEPLNANEGAESTLAFHRAQLLLDAAGLPRVLAPAQARRAPRRREAERTSSSAATPATRS